MNRKEISVWGLDLDPRQFNMALVAALVLGACKPQLRTNLKQSTYAKKLLSLIRNPGTDSGAVPAVLDPLRIVRWQRPEILANAWESMLDDLNYNDYHPIRIELTDWEGKDSRWLLDLLFKEDTDVSIHSLFLCDPAPEYHRKWSLPLRVGLLPNSASRHLWDYIETSFPYEWLIRLVILQPGQENCDLLLLPDSIQASLPQVLSLPFRPSAGCALVLGGSGTPSDTLIPLVQALRVHLCAAAIGVLQISPDDQRTWFEHAMAEWSHNNSIDLALFSAGVYMEIPPPMFISDPGFIATTRIQRFTQELATRLRYGQIAIQGLQVPDNLLHNLNLYGKLALTSYGRIAPQAVPEIAARIEEHLDMARFAWHAESSDAKDFSELAGAVTEIDVPPPEDRRYLQTQISLSGDLPEKSVVKKALIADHAYRVTVLIDEPHLDWSVAPQAFPDHQIDYSRGIVKLDVVFVEPNLSVEPLSGTLELASEGPSTVCCFDFQAPRQIDRFHARIIVLHQNRVLQSVFLEGRIVADQEAMTDQDAIGIGMESLLRNGFQDLEYRRHFDAALVVNHTPQGRAGATALIGGEAHWIAIDSLETTIDRFKRKLNAIARDPEQYDSLESEASLNLIRYFAYHGRSLYEGIIQDWQLTQLSNADRIQVVSARAEAFLPLELVYDGARPSTSALICPNTQQALLTGECTACGDHCANGEVICMLGFWSLKKVIERHAFDPHLANTARGDFGLLSNPRTNCDTLYPMRSAVFGASSRVDDVLSGMRSQVVQTLQNVVKGTVARADDWNRWVQDVGAVEPSLLVLLPHTLLDEFTDAETLEIGSNSQRRTGDINIDYVHPNEAAPPPIVLLLGCETGVADVPFESYVAAFRRSQAAMVVSSLSKVLGRHAAPVAETFILELNQAAGQDPKPFGEVAREVRRKLVRQGLLVALALTVYGDADWLLSVEDNNHVEH